jgi:hypothetical protein
MNTTTSPIKPKQERISQKAPLKVRELTPDSWAQWRHHPVTKALHQYLADYRAQLLRDHLRRFVGYAEAPNLENEARARSAVILDVVALDFNAIREFYQPLDGMEPDYVNPLSAEIPQLVEDELTLPNEGSDE